MAYVDLNPVRAAIAETPETSKHTSIKERIVPQFNLTTAIKNAQETSQPLQDFTLPVKPLLHFELSNSQTTRTGIPFRWLDYLQLVDWTGRAIRDDKRGYINNTLPPILDRLGIDEDEWIESSTRFEQCYQKKNRPQAA